MSQRFKVASNNLVGHVSGDTVTAADLPEGTNVDALVRAGALKVATKAATPKATTPKADAPDEDKDIPE